MCYAGSLGSNTALISVLFSSAPPGLPGAGPPTRWGPRRCQAFTVRERAGAEHRTRIDTEPPDLLPTLAGALVVGPRGETDCNCVLVQERKRRTKTFFSICFPVSHIPSPGSFSVPSFLQAFPSTPNITSFTTNLKTTGVSQRGGHSQESLISAFTWNYIYKHQQERRPTFTSQSPCCTLPPHGAR